MSVFLQNLDTQLNLCAIKPSGAPHPAAVSKRGAFAGLDIRHKKWKNADAAQILD